MKSKRVPKKKEIKFPTEVEIPNLLNPNGLYSIQFSQAEMYDLGNLRFIKHYILYDRKEKLALDITSDIEPAPLLSRTQPANLLDDQDIEFFEEYLKGKIKSEYWPEENRGTRYFKAREFIGPQYDAVRAKMIQVRDARKSLESAIEGLRGESILLGKYIHNGSKKL